jgi:predicted dienelactone hydrolase
MIHFVRVFRSLLIVVSLSLCNLVEVSAADPIYDPLAIAKESNAPPLDLTVHDAARKRDIPIRIYLPPDKSPAPVILFSHGLGGNRKGSAFLGRHGSARGYAVVFLQHPGSDDSVWKNTRPLERMGALKQAASAENFMLRVADVPAVLNALQAWNQSRKPQEPKSSQSDAHVALAGRLSLEKVGMSGHSFGAVTTQAVSGQAYAGGRQPFVDPRIKAAVVMSPSTPRRGTPADAFSSVAIPWLLLTGTLDGSPIGDQTPESRRAVYPALPQGGKYELVLHNAEHSAFTDRALPGDRRQRNSNHHRAILAVTTAFWDAYLRDGEIAEQARKWLNGDGPRKVLEENDLWQFRQ